MCYFLIEMIKETAFLLLCLLQVNLYKYLKSEKRYAIHFLIVSFTYRGGRLFLFFNPTYHLSLKSVIVKLKYKWVNKIWKVEQNYNKLKGTPKSLFLWRPQMIFGSKFTEKKFSSLLFSASTYFMKALGAS